MKSRATALAALVSWIAFLCCALASVHALGSGPLSLPPMPRSATALLDWYEQRDAATLVFVGVRLGVLVTGWYLLVTTLLSVLSTVSRWSLFFGSSRAASIADSLTRPLVRRLVHAAVGASVSASAAFFLSPPAGIGARAAIAAPSDPVEVTMRRLPEAPEPSDVTVTMRRVDDGAAESQQLVPVTWAVKPGNSFWSIAEDTLEASLGRSVSDLEIDPFWRATIELNRARIPDPSNPDLLFAGLVLELPPVPTAAGA